MKSSTSKYKVSKSTSDNKHLKIAMIGHKRVPSREGGIEVVVEELSTRMVKSKHEVTCYNRKGHHISGKEFDILNQDLSEYKGIRLKSVFTINRKGFAAIISSMLGAFYIALGQYDIVHFHALGPCAMLWLPKLMGKRCIATVHGLDHQRSKWGKLASIYIIFGEKVAVRFADEIIVLSKDIQNYFMTNYCRKTVFIPNGVNKPKLQDAKYIIEKWGLEKDSYILFLGRLVPEKGLSYLINAFKRVNTNKKLVIAGGCSDTYAFLNELKRISKSDDRIIFTGFVQGKVLDELYSNAYLYTLPSDLEGMPLSLLEAMSYGNCCVVSDINECSSVVTDSDRSLKAVIFKKSNIEDLKDRLQELCDKPAMVQLYKNQAADYIIKKYNWDDVVKATLELYNLKQ